MKRILVPTDFSKCANNAMNYALEIARRSGAEVYALYVVFPNDGLNNNVYDAFWIDDYLKQRLKNMKDWANKLRKKGRFQDITVQVDCKVGFPVSMISETALEIAADLIVMGTTGATGLKGMLLGSTAGGVIVSSKLPVFIVPPKASFTESGNFVFATDFKFKVNESSIEAMKELLRMHRSGLQVVHVFSQETEKPLAAREESFSLKLKGISHRYHYIHDKNIARAIDNYIESSEASGLVAISHHHSLLHQLFNKSISRTLAHQIITPLLVLHDAT